jgi:Domain of unknown function (DUF3846)
VSTGLLVRVDGTFETLDADLNDPDAVRRAIGCTWFESHPAGHLLVWVDEEGRFNGSGPNLAASALAALLGTPQPTMFAGDAVFTDAGDPDGNLQGLDEATQLGLLGWLTFLGPFPNLTRKPA